MAKASSRTRGSHSVRIISTRTRGSHRVHIISTGAGWAIKTGGTSKASKIYSRKNSAVSGARRRSGKHDVVIHKRDGSIEKWERSR